MRALCKKPCVICRFVGCAFIRSSDHHRAPKAYLCTGKSNILLYIYVLMYFRTLVHFFLCERELRIERGGGVSGGGLT